MKIFRILLLFLLPLSCLSGYLMSKASFVGRVGINFFYKEYKFLKIWWQGALLVFIALLLVLLAHRAAQKMTSKSRLLTQAVLLIVAFIGLYLTYSDFRHTLSHRLLGERFHLGAYLFWLGWIVISVTYLFSRKRARLTA